MVKHPRASCGARRRLGCSSPEAARSLSQHTGQALFERSRAPEAALAALWVYFSCFDEGHKLAQDIDSPEGSYWHAILHRHEPDACNSTYWFGKVGAHPIYGDLLAEAQPVLQHHPGVDFHTPSRWDSLAFISFCERARREPESSAERAALEIQRAEWQLLFDYCARPR